MTKKRQQCYTGIFNKIDHIQERIIELKEQIASLKDGLLDSNGKGMCMDEVEAEQALLKLMKTAALDAWLDSDPKGDA